MPGSTVIPELVYRDLVAAVDWPCAAFRFTVPSVRAATALGSPRAWAHPFPYGERRYAAADLAGHRWWFIQSITDVAPESSVGVSGPAL
jgi:uncharacterized glyoxalase superfamily protein PhnB